MRSSIFNKYWEMKDLGKLYSSSYIEIKSDWRALEKRQLNKSPQGKLLKRKLTNINSVLDIGCGQSPVRRALADLGIIAKYESVDPDPSVKATYTAIDLVHKKYDCIFMLEVIEHLPLEDAISCLSKIYNSLTECGILMLSTPNIDHPNYFWRIDITHIRPYPKNDLVGLLRQVGFRGEIEVCRQYYRYGNRNVLKQSFRRIITPFAKLLYRIMDLDHAQAILIFAEKS
jgi:SAM-dependent methyltransferase